jgi:nicotinamidase-related amidase
MASRTALFVIDIQNDLATIPETKIPHADRVISAGKQILAAARGVIDSERKIERTASGLIVVVQHEEKPEAGSLVRGTDPWKAVFPPRADDADEFLVAKTTRELPVLHGILWFSSSVSRLANARHCMQAIPSSRILVWRRSCAAWA